MKPSRLNYRRSISAFICTMVLPVALHTARADETHEVVLAGTQGLLSNTQGNLLVSSGAVAQMAATYNYTLDSMFQIGGGFNLVAGGTTAIQILAGPTFNFPSGTPLSERFFVNGMIGLIGTTSSTLFGGVISFGKRFRLFEHLSYRPSLGVVLSALIAFKLDFIAVSIHF